jgi:gliding motility-associated lipoprotein GldH
MMRLRYCSQPFFGVAIVALFALSSCGPKPLSTDTAAVDPGGWSQADTAHLSFEIEQADRLHNVFISLRHNDDYPFNNAYFFVQLVSPGGRTLTDTLSCPLALEDGRWLGRTWGKWIDHKIGYKPQVQFPEAGLYELRVVHAMRRNPLPGVASVGVDVFELSGS